MEIKSGPLVLFFFLCINFSALAQDPDLRPPRQHLYFNSFQAGALLAEDNKGTSFTFSTVHGVNRGGMIIGIGAGFDSYQRWKTLPVSMVIGCDLTKIKNNALYLSLSLGYAWGRFRPQTEYDAEISGAKGVMLSPTLGYKIKADKFNLYMSAGYRFQRLDYTASPLFWGNTQSVEEDIQRIVVQIGFGLD